MDSTIQEPLVSVCVPVYNAEDTIADTLQSLLNQTYPNIEIHVLDNVSTDKTVQIIQGFNNERIHLHVHPFPIDGIMNIGRCLHVGNGKYRAIYHADDVYEPSIVERSVQFLEKHLNAGGVLTRGFFINKQGEIIGQSKTFKELGFIHKDYVIFNHLTLIKKILCYHNFLMCPSFMAHGNICEKIDRWRDDLFRTGCDLDVWLRIAEKYNIGFLSEPLIRYRTGPHKRSYKIDQQRTKPADIFQVLRFWLNKKDIRKQLTSEDKKNHALLYYHDLLWRITHALLMEDEITFTNLLKKAKVFRLGIYYFFPLKNFKYLFLYQALKLSKWKYFRCLLYPILKRSS